MRIFFLFFLIMMISCQKNSGVPNSDSKELSSQIVAQIGNTQITKEQFDDRYQWYVDRFKYKVPKKDFLENLINLELSAEEALKQGLDREAKLKYDIRVLLSQHLLEKEVYSKFKDLKFSDEELEVYFKEFPEIRASHILFKVEPNEKPEKIEEIKKKAEKVLKRVKKGEDFAKLSNEFSEGPSKRNGGDLDYFMRESMVAEFSDAAFALKNMGDVSNVVRTKYGFHIIKLTGRKNFKDADKNRIRNQLRSKKQKEIYDVFFQSLRVKASVKVNDGLVEDN